MNNQSNILSEHAQLCGTVPTLPNLLATLEYNDRQAKRLSQNMKFWRSARMGAMVREYLQKLVPVLSSSFGEPIILEPQERHLLEVSPQELSSVESGGFVEIVFEVFQGQLTMLLPYQLVIAIDELGDVTSHKHLRDVTVENATLTSLQGHIVDVLADSLFVHQQVTWRSLTPRSPGAIWKMFNEGVQATNDESGEHGQDQNAIRFLVYAVIRESTYPIVIELDSSLLKRIYLYARLRLHPSRFAVIQKKTKMQLRLVYTFPIPSVIWPLELRVGDLVPVGTKHSFEFRPGLGSDTNDRRLTSQTRISLLIGTPLETLGKFHFQVIL